SPAPVDTLSCPASGQGVVPCRPPPRGLGCPDAPKTGGIQSRECAEERHPGPGAPLAPVLSGLTGRGRSRPAAVALRLGSPSAAPPVRRPGAIRRERSPEHLVVGRAPGDGLRAAEHLASPGVPGRGRSVPGGGARLLVQRLARAPAVSVPAPARRTGHLRGARHPRG